MVCPSSQHVWPQMGELLLWGIAYPVWFHFAECDTIKTHLSKKELLFKSFSGCWTALWPDLALWQYWASVWKTAQFVTQMLYRFWRGSETTQGNKLKKLHTVQDKIVSLSLKRMDHGKRFCNFVQQIHSKEGVQPGVWLYSPACTTMTKVFTWQGELLSLPGETFCLLVQSLLLNYQDLCS